MRLAIREADRPLDLGGPRAARGTVDLVAVATGQQLGRVSVPIAVVSGNGAAFPGEIAPDR